MTQMPIKTKKPVEYLELWGAGGPPAIENPETICPLVGCPCCCWFDGECKDPRGQCDGE